MKSSCPVLFFVVAVVLDVVSRLFIADLISLLLVVQSFYILVVQFSKLDVQIVFWFFSGSPFC